MYSQKATCLQHFNQLGWFQSEVFYFRSCIFLDRIMLFKCFNSMKHPSRSFYMKYVRQVFTKNFINCLLFFPLLLVELITTIRKLTLSFGTVHSVSSSSASLFHSSKFVNENKDTISVRLHALQHSDKYLQSILLKFVFVASTTCAALIYHAFFCWLVRIGLFTYLQNGRGVASDSLFWGTLAN